MTIFRVCAVLTLVAALAGPAAAQGSGPIDFNPAQVPPGSPFNYSEYWSISTLLLDLHWNPGWAVGNDALNLFLFVPIPEEPGYRPALDWRLTMQSLHMARSVQFSGEYLLGRLQDTVTGGPEALAPNTLGRLRIYNGFDIFFHVGPDWVPSPGDAPRPFISIWIADPFDFYRVLDNAEGGFFPTIAHHDFEILNQLHDFGRDHGTTAITVSHGHVDHWLHPLFLDAITQGGATAKHGPGREPQILVPVDVYSFVQATVPGVSSSFLLLNEAQPFVAPVAGTTESFRIDAIESYQDLEIDGQFNNGDPHLNGLRVSFPGGPTIVALSEGTYLDLPAFQARVPVRPDYLLGLGSHTAPAVHDWLFDAANGGANGAAHIPSGYHNFHAAPGWVPFPASNPNATHPGFVQFYSGG